MLNLVDDTYSFKSFFPIFFLQNLKKNNTYFEISGFTQFLQKFDIRSKVYDSSFPHSK